MNEIKVLFINNVMIQICSSEWIESGCYIIILFKKVDIVTIVIIFIQFILFLTQIWIYLQSYSKPSVDKKPHNVLFISFLSLVFQSYLTIVILYWK